MPNFTTAQIINAANDFLFTSPAGEQFYAPYLINKNFTQDPSVPRGLGKASPAEIKASIDYITEMFPSISADDIRVKLVDGSLPEKSMNYKGIDCSGFVYIVFEKLYRELYGKEFASVLSVPKGDVLNGAFNLDDWKAAYTLSAEEAAALPEDVPVSWVCEKFHRKPINLCRVTGLVSDYSSTKVEVPDIRSGDLIHTGTTNDPTPHVMIVASVAADTINVMHATRVHLQDPGGVKYDTFRISEGKLLQEQETTDRLFIGARRLKEC